jgi:Nucleotidyltransferase of unknown function (DUF6036)
MCLADSAQGYITPADLASFRIVTYGYYAHGVGPETAKAPAGWAERLVRVEIPPRPGHREGAIALCLEPHDLLLAKCVAGRERDWEFVREALAAGLVQFDRLLTRIGELPIDAVAQERVRSMLSGIGGRLGLDQAQ